jgi:hypothetical protein
MAVHKHCYTSPKLTQQGGPGRRETARLQFRIRAEIDKSAVRRGLFVKGAAPPTTPVSGEPVGVPLPEAVPPGHAVTENTV